MKLVLHAGAHITDEDRLLKCLTANQDILEQRGTKVPAPRHYRRLLRDILHSALESGVPPDTSDVLMEALGLNELPDRLILSNPGFFGTPKMAASGGAFYTSAAPRTQMLQQIFDGASIELFFAICNPALFLPGIFAQTSFDSLPEYLSGTAPSDMRWSAMIERVRSAIPEIPITVWCNEDTPLIWGQILREMADIDPNTPLNGEHALVHELLTPDGASRFETYLADHPDLSEMQKRRVIWAFLDKFADETAIEEEVTLPGWSEDLVDELSALYDEDVYRIGRTPGITLIAP